MSYLDGDVGSGVTDEKRGGRDQVVAEKAPERRVDLLLGEIAGSAEDDEDVCDLVLDGNRLPADGDAGKTLLERILFRPRRRHWREFLLRRHFRRFFLHQVNTACETICVITCNAFTKVVGEITRLNLFCAY